MAFIVCRANVLSPQLSLSSSSFSSSSSSSSSAPSAAVGAASNWRYPVVLLSNLRSLPTKICCAASPASQGEPQRDGRPRFRDFPYASAPIRDLMAELLSMVETRLGPKLVPHTLPPDVEYYTNESGTNHGSLYVRAGAPSSRIDFLLGSWRHCEVRPQGEPMDITILRCFMNSSTDVPELVVKFDQYSPTSLRITLDLSPRRDLALSATYLETFYKKTELDRLRKFIFCSVPESGTYQDPCLYLRCALSPTAIAVGFKTSACDGEGETRLEEIIRTEVRAVAKAVVETWLDVCGQRWRVTQEEDRPHLKERDFSSKLKTIRIDIVRGLPEMFGQEIADRVHAELEPRWLNGSWLHRKVSMAAELNITTFSCYMNDTTDAPPFFMVFIQGSPTSLVNLLDLSPRGNLVIHPDYPSGPSMKTQSSRSTNISFLTRPLRPSPARSAFSPTIIVARVDTSGAEGGETRLEEIVKEKVGPTTNAVLETWLEVCVREDQKRECELEDDKAYLTNKDVQLNSSMALIFCKANLLSPPLSLSSSSPSPPSAAVGAASNWRYPVVSLSNLRSLPTRICCAASPASQEEPHRDARPKFKDFPYASAPLRDLMVEVLSMVESRLGTQLVPHTLPPNVEYYTNKSGTNHGCLYVLTGAPSSRVDFILGSWQHWEFLAGGTGHAINLSCFMKVSTDAPPLTMEFVQCSPTLLRFTIDLPPRKELAISDEYLTTFYIDTELDKSRHLIACTIPEALDYTPPCLVIRLIFSPTAIMACVDTSESDGGGETRLEEILREEVTVAAKKVVETWLDVCACGKGRKVTRERERNYMKVRDRLLRDKVIEIDIGCCMDKKFGEENAYWVLGALRSFVASRR
ncbi:hypothetical protein Cgig2_007996 [Carnegiea gigantea]|uniref:Uncharacterized protein n=1 Tax=Carnegiea gigantea TaxID=171969 RepID=A0A9Q1L090_9CARY|nr:hypothetical protein Cgig2_007996 [Carnegiea gigantea]